MNSFDRNTYNGVRVCDIIKQARKTAKMSQKELAEAIGFTVSGLSNWETGAREPPVSIFMAILEICGVSIVEAYGISAMPGLSESALNLARQYDSLVTEQKEYVTGIVNHEVFLRNTLPYWSVNNG